MSDETRQQPVELPPGAVPARNGGYIIPGSNGGGRPKGSVGVRKFIRDLLEDNEYKKAKEVADALIEQAKAGNAAAIRQVVDGIDGPITERVDQNVTIKVVHEDPLELTEDV